MEEGRVLAVRALLAFLLDVLVVAFALWVVVRFVPGVDIVAGRELSLEWTFVAVAAVFVVVNGVLGPVLRLLGMPLTCVTLGLFSLVINAVIFAVVGWVSRGLDLGLFLDGFWPTMIGAAVIGVVRWFVGLFTRQGD